MIEPRAHIEIARLNQQYATLKRCFKILITIWFILTPVFIINIIWPYLLLPFHIIVVSFWFILPLTTSIILYIQIKNTAKINQWQRRLMQGKHGETE